MGGCERRERLGPGPRAEAVRPLPSPRSARGLGPGRCHPATRGGPGGSAARGRRGWRGLGGLAGGGRGLRAERRRLGSAPGKVWTWETPSPPAPPRGGGTRGPGAGTRAPPAAGGSRAPHPPRAACRATPAGQGGLPPGRASLPSAAIRLPLTRHPALLPRGAARGSPSPAASGRCVGREPRRGRAGESGARRPPRRSRRESGRERGSRGGVCARVCERESEGERGSERAGARECACLTRGEVCKGRIPSFLPQPLVETRRMQRPPGRSAAPRRAAGGRRAGTPKPGSPGPRPRIAPLPRRRGPASPSHPRPRPRNPRGAVPLLLPTADAREGSAPRRGAVSLLAWQLSPETPSLRSDPSPLDFTASRVPRFLRTTKGAGFQRRGAQERVGVRFLQRPPLAGCPESTSAPPALALTL